MRYKTSGGAEMTDYPLVRACASLLISVVRDSSATLVAVWQSKCNTFFNEVGELATLFASSTGKKGMQTWDIANSPRTKDTP